MPRALLRGILRVWVVGEENGLGMPGKASQRKKDFSRAQERGGHVPKSRLQGLSLGGVGEPIMF